MFYPTSKFHDNSVNTFGLMGGGGGGAQGPGTSISTSTSTSTFYSVGKIV